MQRLGEITLICVLVRALWLCEAGTPENNVENKEMHLFGGDILLTEKQNRLLHRDAALPTRARHARAVVKLRARKWEAGEVPYELSSDFNNTGINAIQLAMDRIMLDTGHCVKFRPKQDFDFDYLYIFPGDGCYSYIGRQGGSQNVSIGPKCQIKGVIMHELIHALGRWHEQSRPDRDSYIRVNVGNIKEGYTSNFDIVNAEETSTQALSYDYDSIMHYDAFAFSANDHPTITPVDELVVQDRLGQRERLSETDKEHIKKLYCMKSFWSSWSSWTECSKSCGGGLQHRSRQCLGEGQCRGSREDDRSCNEDECPTAPAPAWGAWSQWSGCSQSCGSSGLRFRIRICLEHEEQQVAEKCAGKKMEEQEEECNTQQCPEEAEWSAWSRWTLCSTMCEGGVRYRSRECVLNNHNTAASGNQLHCTGESMESKACFVNVSCGLRENRTFSSAEELCSDGSCFNDTCLAGLMSVGCYHMPSTVTLSALVTLEDGGTVWNVSTGAESLKTCGDYAMRKGLTNFALSGNQCYCSRNVTDFITGGPSESCRPRCRTGDCLEVFQIAERETFELSVRAFESCGPDYCSQEAGVCSSGARTALGGSIALHFALLILWVVTG